MRKNTPSTANSLPRVSVIIPTHNRADLLRGSLQSLAEQSLPKSEYEVIVVDDGSPDTTKQVCEDLSRELPLRYFRIKNSGIAAAKNLGIFTSRAPILFFFDDDDVADRNLLTAHLTAHERNNDFNVAILGYTMWSPHLTVTPVMHYITEVGKLLFDYTTLRDGQCLPYHFFWGGRSSCRRELLVKHGVFNQDFRFSEDIELAYRLSKFGLKVYYTRDAISHMVRPITTEAFCNRCHRQGRAIFQLSQTHPDPEIQKYCQVLRASDKWRERRPRVAGVASRVHEIESLLRLRPDLSGSTALITELHNHYGWLFESYRLKGIVEALSSNPIAIGHLAHSLT